MPLSVLPPPSFKRTDTDLFQEARQKILLGKSYPSALHTEGHDGFNDGGRPGIHQALIRTTTLVESMGGTQSKGAIETAGEYWGKANSEAAFTAVAAEDETKKMTIVQLVAPSLRQVRSSFFPSAGQPGKEVVNGHDDSCWEVAILQVLRAYKDAGSPSTRATLASQRSDVPSFFPLVSEASVPNSRPALAHWGTGALGHGGVCTPVPLASIASRSANRIIGLTRNVREVPVLVSGGAVLDSPAFSPTGRPATLRRATGGSCDGPTYNYISPRGKYHRSMTTHTRSFRKKTKRPKGPRIIWAVVG
ncbi:uncharacterized protein B0T23DRAFT_408316 [Neurospora hispaniola]|uniref:Uncharacterized protein n=1 Tax=Neurospora hispaniola TaxID=588809 RepID=A0AAJ0HYV5_9PEZI|nr:hypothetical protein B0T23DRAFT_408316 [Neurospora hispaniola]